ncbi:MAG: hypothetical protein PUP93_22055 [Rhizonema sp. NSF051]|nr:hypothetical protein [Rhizonema sp. NSF051]
MLRLYHVLLGMILLALAPPVVKFAFPHFSLFSNVRHQPVIESNANRTQVSMTTSTNSHLSEGNVWKSILGKTVAPPEWQVAACKENGSLLCVSSKGKLLGTVEMGVYPLGQQADFQKMLKSAGIPLDANQDYQNQKYQSQISIALKAWITDRYMVLSKDSQVTSGDNVTFSQQLPQNALVGKLRGMHYGFEEKQQDEVKEKYTGYVAFDGTALYVITTAFDSTQRTGKFETLESFQSFEPHLSAIVANLNLSR